MTYKVVVYHGYYGCGTGCCGHYMSVNEEDIGGMSFSHPYGTDPKEWALEFAKQRILSKFGPDHTVDLDWENCHVSED